MKLRWQWGSFSSNDGVSTSSTTTFGILMLWNLPTPEQHKPSKNSKASELTKSPSLCWDCCQHCPSTFSLELRFFLNSHFSSQFGNFFQAFLSEKFCASQCSPHEYQPQLPLHTGVVCWASQEEKENGPGRDQSSWRSAQEKARKADPEAWKECQTIKANRRTRSAVNTHRRKRVSLPFVTIKLITFKFLQVSSA